VNELAPTCFRSPCEGRDLFAKYSNNLPEGRIGGGMGPCLCRDPVEARGADAALFLRHEAQGGENWWSVDNLTVAFSAGLFWPVDLVAKSLLGF
jgi:hypothetical protein